jgi:hypothetical protein
VTLTAPAYGNVLLYDGTKWINSALKTINGQPLIGSGDISVGGGASGNYLPLTGGTLTGLLTCANGTIVIDAYADYTPNRGIYLRGGEFTSTYKYNLSITTWDYSTNNITPDGLSINAYDGIGFCTGGNNTRVERMRITSNGRVGIATTSPQYTLDVLGVTSITSNEDRCLRINRNGNFALITFMGDENYFGYYSIGNCILCHNNFCTDNKIGIKTTFPSYDLDVSGVVRINSSDDRYLRIQGSTSNFFLISFYDDNHYFGYVKNENIFNLSHMLRVDSNIYASGAITALSDARKKDIMGAADVTVEQIAHAPAVLFLWKGERAKEGLQVGTLAQYWQTVLPEVVMDKGGELSMQYGVAALVSAIVTARKVVDHERRITELEKENERLRTEVEQLRLN